MDRSAKINIAKEKLYWALYSHKPHAGTSQDSRDTVIFAIVSPHGNVDSHEYKLS